MNYTRNWLKWNPENFPVASWLLPPETREPILTFYAFARGADEIADSNQSRPEERRRELAAIEEALTSGNEKALPDFALPFMRLARNHPPLLSRARDLLSAFMQDTMKSRYHDYNDLLDYCQRSAASVGRAFLYICGEDKADLAAANSLCNALQLLNHIQDCSDDYVNLDRVYLPLNWFTEAGINVKVLASSDSTPALRRILNRALDNCDILLRRARPLVRSVSNRQVRREVMFIYILALRLSVLLRKRDPLGGHVKVGKWGMLQCLIEVFLTV